MKYFGLAICLALILGFTHKYYISNTLIHYNTEAQSLEISIKIFTDDFERALQEQTGATINLGGVEEHEEAHRIIGDYLKQHFSISISDNKLDLNYLGKEDEVDITRCYIEISNIPEFSEISISNSILFDQFEDQANIIDFDYGDFQKQIILNVDHKSEIIKL